MSLTVQPDHSFPNDLCEILDGGHYAAELPWEEIPQLITDLRRSYNEWKKSTEQSDADGVVAAILLQSHVATAPGDFS